MKYGRLRAYYDIIVERSVSIVIPNLRKTATFSRWDNAKNTFALCSCPPKGTHKYKKK